MSRSRWALAEARRRGRLVRGAGERRWFGGRSRPGQWLPPGAVSAAKCAAVMAAVGMLIIAAEPARALAASGRRVEKRTAQVSPSANQAADPVVLGSGSGYGGGHDAALVRSLQRRLDRQGYSPGPVDGRYGPRTETAVEAFQRARGLRVDGIAGPLTLAALRTMVLYPGTGYAGAGSTEVRRLQRQLRRDGGNPGPIDGRYGPLTEAAVRRFQAAHGLKVDGIAGAHTFGELERTAGKKRPATPSAQPGHRTNPSRTRRPRPSHPVVPPPPRATTTPHTHGRTASRSPGASWPVALMVLGVICLATLLGGVLLIDRRRRAAKLRAVPSEYAGGPVAAAELAHGDAHDDRHGDANDDRHGDAHDDRHGDPVAASNRGVLLEDRGDLAGAEDAYREADAGGSADGAFNLAGLLFDRGEVEEAMAAYSRAEERGDPIAAATLGMLLFKRGDTAAAEEVYGRADQLGDAGAAVNVGFLRERRGDIDGAEAAYRRADERGSAEGAFNLGELLRERGDLANAIAAYRRADERGDPTAALKAGMLLERTGCLPEALAEYQRAQQCDRPEVAEAARSREEALALGISLAGKRGGR